MYADKPLLHQRQALHQRGQLRTLSIDVTGKCNMHCSKCYAATFMSKKPVEMDVLLKAIQEADAMGVFHYVLQGGEPIADFDRLSALLTGMPRERCFINVVSNGWDMTPNMIYWLRTMDVDKIALSMDSGIEAEHDFYRGQGSFNRVVQAVKDIKQAGLLTSISMVITHKNLYSAGFIKAYDFARDNDLKFDVQIAVPTGNWQGCYELCLDVDDIRYLDELRQYCGKISNGQEMIHRDLFCADGKKCCPAGTEFMAISVDGEFLPCNFLQTTLGNIANESLKTMRDRLLKCIHFQGKNDKCLAGEDREFIETYFMYNSYLPRPLDANKLFQL